MKIRSSYETAIDVTQSGYVRIEQADPMGDEPDVVLLMADQLPAVIRELQALLEDRASWDFDERDQDEAAARGITGTSPTPA